MTPDRRQSDDGMKLPGWVMPLLPIVIGALFAVGAARVQLGGKEDTSAHAADVSETKRLHTADIVKQQGQIDSIRYAAQTTAVRDSAWRADAMRILLDLQRRTPR
jgi:hypothetical protein